MDLKNEKFTDRRQQLGQAIKKISEYLELILAVIILIGIILRFVQLPQGFAVLFTEEHDGFTTFVDYVVDSVIGVELVHLLCQPNLDSVVEILLVAITREIITLEGDALSALLYVLCLAILFALRRFMFVDKLDRHDSDFSLKALKEHRERKHAADKQEPEAANKS